MTRKEARAILGNEPEWALRGMARALGMLTYLGADADWTEDDWRLAEALRALGYCNAPRRP